MTPKILYIANQGLPAFEAARAAVDIVCAGDSLTGRNDFGPVRYWPCRTYPDFLQILCKPFRLRIANGGITRAISDNGQQMVQDYLALFPNARCFVIGMGLSDNGTWPDMEATSKRNIGNLGAMAQAVHDQGKKAVLLNVPDINEDTWPSPLASLARRLNAKRDYHNARLKEFCDEQGIPLADICSRLKDEYVGDKLHPNLEDAKIIAEEVFKVLAPLHKSA